MQKIFSNIILEDIDSECHPTRKDWKASMGTKVLYKRAETRSLAEVQSLLESLDDNSAYLEEARESSRNCRRTLCLVATRLLSFFVPTETDAKPITKYWGAIYRLLSFPGDMVGL